MNLFLLAAVVILGATVLLLWPGVSGRRRVNDDNARLHNIHISRQRLQEATPAEATEQDAAEARAIEAALLDDLNMLKRDAERPPAARRIPGIISSLILLCIPLASLALYLHLGNPGAMVTASMPPPYSQTAAEIKQRLSRLEKSLVDNPDDIRGWSLLARSYATLGEHAKAEQAYAQLNRLQPDQVHLLIGWAKATILANDNRYTPAAQKLVQQVLTLEPQNIDGLWLSALGNISLGEPATARRQLEELKKLTQDDADSVRQIEEVMEGL